MPRLARKKKSYKKLAVIRTNFHCMRLKFSKFLNIELENDFSRTSQSHKKISNLVILKPFETILNKRLLSYVDIDTNAIEHEFYGKYPIWIHHFQRVQNSSRSIY